MENVISYSKKIRTLLHIGKYEIISSVMAPAKQKNSSSIDSLLPAPFASWLMKRGWSLHPHQRAMLEVAQSGASCLLIAPTGGGKTLAGFLPSLIELAEHPAPGLHTLYLSPLKALTHDIHRNLLAPIEEIGLPIIAETRTGDTAGHIRQRQRKHPPHILLTTPESLALMLSYPESRSVFSTLKTIILDEAHTLPPSKRGLHTALLLSRLESIAPKARRIGLSATVADPSILSKWLGRDHETVRLVQAESHTQPEIEILLSRRMLPLAGHFPRHAIPEIYAAITDARSAIVFVNTRAQAEMMFQALWEANDKGLSIALHHGSLNREQRQKVEAAMASGEVRAVVATASLDLGIDWGNVDLVIQIGAPKGISRLLQRIGRSNHRYEEPSRALLVPANCFEAVECYAAINAIKEGQLDSEPPYPATLDILAQHLIGCACAEPIEPDALFHEVTRAAPYRILSRETFDSVLQFVIDGGYVLQRYEAHQRLTHNEHGLLRPSNKRIEQRYRMNIGTIVEAEKLRVFLVTSKPGGRRRSGVSNGKYLGEVEERLILGMQPGDTFLFAGQHLRYERVRDLILEVSPATGSLPKIPSFVGGRMPLSTHLAARVRRLLSEGSEAPFSDRVATWIMAQATLSQLPTDERLLVETFERQGLHYLVAYAFEGRAAHHSLGFLLTRRMEVRGLRPLGFVVNDYALALWGSRPITEETLATLFAPDLLTGELEEWLAASPMLKRSFRQTAVISGLIEQKHPGQQKTGKQVTFSSDLIYDVLRQYEPDHILLQSTRLDAERELIGTERLTALLTRYQNRLDHMALPRLSPFSIPVILEVGHEAVAGSAVEELLREQSLAVRAESLLEESVGYP
jgi:ATP-dependent Lhr-like helicase